MGRGPLILLDEAAYMSARGQPAPPPGSRRPVQRCPPAECWPQALAIGVGTGMNLPADEPCSLPRRDAPTVRRPLPAASSPFSAPRRSRCSVLAATVALTALRSGRPAPYLSTATPFGGGLDVGARRGDRRRPALAGLRIPGGGCPRPRALGPAGRTNGDHRLALCPATGTVPAGTRRRPP